MVRDRVTACAHGSEVVAAIIAGAFFILATADAAPQEEVGEPSLITEEDDVAPEEIGEASLITEEDDPGAEEILEPPPPPRPTPATSLVTEEDDPPSLHDENPLPDDVAEYPSGEVSTVTEEDDGTIDGDEGNGSYYTTDEYVFQGDTGESAGEFSIVTEDDDSGELNVIDEELREEPEPAE